MNKAIAIGLLAGGVLLTVFGLNAMNSLDSDITRFFTGSPTDRSMYLLVGGVILAVAGLIGMVTGSNKN